MEVRGRLQHASMGLAIAFAIAIVVVNSDRASGQTDLHVFMPASSLRGSVIDVVRGPAQQLGDGVAGRGRLIDPATGENAGTLYQECTVMRKIGGLEQGLWRCSYHLRLEGGSVVLQGLDPRGSGSSKFAVLGGTDAYRGASGDAVLTDSDGGTDIAISLT